MAAALVYGVLLAGCNAASDDPLTAAPAQTVVLQGTVTGLGTRRPLVLQYNGSDMCINPAAPAGPRVECRFFGVLNQQTSAFSFGALPVGTPYNITVKTQPFGKQCTVANGAGTLSTTPASITVTCVNDAAVPRYSISGSVPAGVAALPGAKVLLTTEDGVQETMLNGATTFQFSQALFDSGSNLPVFTYAITATYAGTDGKVNNCTVINGTNVAVDGSATSPAGNVNAVQIVACTFPVSVTVGYSGTPATALGAGGMTLELRDPATGSSAVVRDPVSGLDATVPPLNINSFTTASFSQQVLSNPAAIYDLVITGQPAGQTCVVGSATQLTQGSAVLLLNPADAANGFFTSKNVRCRANPPVAGQLRGTYQQTSIVTTTVTRTVGTGSPVATVTPVTTANRNFLTFFEDGTFLYGVHATGGNCNANCGVEHGFYAYNSAAGSITFTPLVDTITGNNANRLSSGGAAANLTSVVKTPGGAGQITARFNSTSPVTTTTTEAGTTTITTASSVTDWRLDPPESIDGQMTGAWATADHRRVWVYDGSRYAGFHAGVNGLGNAQDACFPIDDPAVLSGTFTRRGNGTTCQLGSGSGSNIFTLDIPNGSTVPRLPEGYVGKWP